MKFIKRKWNLAALVLILILGAVLFLVWVRFPEYKSVGGGDPYLDANQYLPGKNFARRGFLREYLLPNYAIGPEEFHPLWYTHNPPLSEIMSGLYYRAGLHEISQQRIIAILWNLLGAWFFYLLLKELINPTIGLLGLAVLISNPLYVAWGDNLFINHQWCFAFACMYFFLRAIHRNGYEQSQRGNLYLVLSIFCFFLLCYSNYEYVPFVAFFFIGGKVFSIKKISWSMVFVSIGAGLAAVIFHQFCIILAIGFDYWLIDKVESLLHRTGIGVSSLMDFYKVIPCLMWEEHARFHAGSNLTGYWENFYLHLENLFGFGWAFLLAGVCIFPGFLLPGTKKEKKVLRRTILLFFLMSISWFIIFAQHTSDHLWGSTILLFAPFAALLYGSTLTGIYSNFFPRKNTYSGQTGRTHLLRTISGGLLLAVVLSGIIGGRILNYRSLGSYPGIDALKNYQGKYFLTSSIPTLVSTYTNTPTGWMGGQHPARIFSHARYLVNPQCQFNFHPDYFFSPYHLEDPKFAPSFDRWLVKNFQIEEAGDCYTIYNLHRTIKNSVSSSLSFRGLNYIRNHLPRAVEAELTNGFSRRNQRRPLSTETEKSSCLKFISIKILRALNQTPLTRRESAPSPIPVQKTGVNLFDQKYKYHTSSAMLTKHPPANLLDPDPHKFWHISLDSIGEPAWISIDFGEEREEIINFIRTKPRPDIMRQSFKTAVIQGSRDGKKWKDIVAIIEEYPRTDQGWKGWYFSNSTPYRIYRFLVVDGHEDDGLFYSLGAMEMYNVNIIGQP